MADEKSGLTADESAYFKNKGEVEAPESDAETEAPEAETEAPKDSADDKKKAEPDKKKADDRPLKMVDHRALVQARGETKAEKAARLKAEQRADRMEELFQRMMKEREQPKAAEAPPPEWAADPAGWLKHQTEQQARKLQEIEARSKKDETSRQQSAEEARLVHAIQASEAEFAAENKDYGDAIAFAQRARLALFQAAGMTPAEAMETLHRETMFFARTALSQGASPAERVYQIAQTLGYKPKGTAAADKVEQIKKGQQAQSPLAGGGEATEGDDMSLKALAELEGDDFDKAWAKYSAKARKSG